MFKKGDQVTITETITDERIRQFAEVSGDKNPVHLDDEYAKTTRFGRRIAHGMLLASLISRALAQDLGPGGIYLGQTLKFLHPVFPGDTVTIELTVLALREEKGIGTIETLVRNQDGVLCVKGEAMIMAKGSV